QTDNCPSGASRARTDDLVAASDALFQLSYSPRWPYPSVFSADGSRWFGSTEARRNPVAGWSPARSRGAIALRGLGCEPPSIPRHELRHVQIAVGFLARRAARAGEGGVPRYQATRACSRRGLIQTGGHAAVSQTHVAQQSLGVASHRG